MRKVKYVGVLPLRFYPKWFVALTFPKRIKLLIRKQSNGRTDEIWLDTDGREWQSVPRANELKLARFVDIIRFNIIYAR